MGNLKILSECLDDLLMEKDSENGENIDEAISKIDIRDLAAMKVLISLVLKLLKRMKDTYLWKHRKTLLSIDSSLGGEIGYLKPDEEKEFKKIFGDKLHAVQNKILEEFGDNFLDAIEEKTEDNKE